MVLDGFNEVNATFPYSKSAKIWKEGGGKVIGWSCNYVPEELIHAAGMLPYRITGNNRSIQYEEAEALLHVYSCSFSKSCLQLGVNGDFDFLDGYLSCAMCDGMRRLGDVWKEYCSVPLLYMISVPRKFDLEAGVFYKNQLEKVREILEGVSGSIITRQKLRESIEVYNETRGLLKRVYELRKSSRPPISGAEALEIMNAAVRMPKEEFNQQLSVLLQKLIEEGDAEKDEGDGAIRLMLSGSILNNADFIKGIEELGCLVVIDGLCTGARYWWGKVDTSPWKDPLEALVEYYLTKFPCPRMYPSELRFDILLKLADEYRVDGVISEVIRYCSTTMYDQLRLRDRFQEQKRIPVLFLDLEYGMGATGQVKTRVQAFVEMLREKKGEA